MMKQVALLILASLAIVHGQIVSLGRCPDYTAQPNFDVEAYTGLWYEIQKYPSAFSNGDCITALYTLSEDGTYVNVKNTQLSLLVWNSIYGTAVVSSEDGSGELSVTLRILGLFNQTSPLIILDTDYTNYSIVYACSNVSKLVKAEFAWVLSRTRELSAEAFVYVDNYIAQSSFLNRRKFSRTIQKELRCGPGNRDLTSDVNQI